MINHKQLQRIITINTFYENHSLSPVKLKHGRLEGIRFLITLITLLLTLFPLPLFAAVSGECYICHTMHNSQNGNSKNMPDTIAENIGWNSSGELYGGSTSSTPANNLLVTSCVGCHSSSTGNTIVTIGANTRVPIVYNTVPPTDKILAGGNFYWIGILGDDTKGHNVYGISGEDSNIPASLGAPGNTQCGGEITACHMTLAAAPVSQNYYRDGCQRCHFNVFHHTDNGQYRFLNGHEGSASYVEGEEHANWEQDATATSLNYYKGYNGPLSGGASLANTRSISTFCSACHYNFHRKSDAFVTGIGDIGAWIRHPTDIALPSTGEYAAYDPVNNYDLDVPVAWTTPTTVSKGTAIVMCLSCHRAHGSDQPDMLRWNYTNDCFISTGSANCGCFTCHSTKN